MKHIMISIKPEWVAKILNGEKTLEIRKTMPKCELPCKVYIYCTKDSKHLVAPFNFVEGWFYKVYDDNTHYCNGCSWNMGETINGKVVAEFTLNYIECWRPKGLLWSNRIDKTCLTIPQLCNYAETNKQHKWHCYAWRIDDLKIYDKSKELSDFKKENKCHYANYEQGCCFENCTFFDLKDCDGKYSKITVAPQSWFYIKGEENET